MMENNTEPRTVPCGTPLSISTNFVEGREGVKWELGFACFFHWEVGFGSLGLGNANKKTIKSGNGTGIWAKSKNGKMGFGQNLGWELGFGTPLHDPLRYQNSWELVLEQWKDACPSIAVFTLETSNPSWTA